MDTALNPDRPDRLATDVAELWTTVQEQQRLLEAQSSMIATLQRRRRRWSLPSLPGLRVTALVAALLVTLQPGVLLAAAAGSWTTVASMPTARQNLAAATGSDGRIYAIGGNNNTGPLSTVEAYTPSTSSWATVSPMPTARQGLAAAAGGDGRIYAMGGYNGPYLNTVEAYTPSSNTWATVASMPTARQNLAAATGSDGRIYAIGGNNNNGSLSTVEAYTPSSNTWATVASMPTARQNLAAATGSDGRIYAIGGNNNTGPLSTVEAYTPSSNTWATVASMSTARQGLAAAAGADGHIYAIGGINNTSGNLNTVEAYTPSTSSWATVSPMPTARQGLAAAAGGDGRIYAMGGYNGLYLNTVEAYTPPSTPGFSAIGQPGIAGYTSSASTLTAPVNAGVYGGSESGVGGWFHSTNGAPLHLDPGATSGPPTSGTFQLGDLYLGSTGVLYLYNGSTWKTLGGGPTDARLTSVHAAAQGTSVRFSWRVADGKGIAGFAVYAQTHRLNRAMIAVHPARSYQYVGHWTGGGPYSLHVLLTTGRQLTVPVH